LLLERYLGRVGLDGSDLSLATLQRAHVASIPYENLDIPLGREIELDLDSLVAKLIDGRRGGYCYEQNLLFAAVLEEVGVAFTRHLGRVRLTDPISPRPETHMVLVVDDHAVDVGFGSATPLGPVPLGGEATYGGWTWRTERHIAVEGDEVWAMLLGDRLLYTFSSVPRHPVDYVAPNHFSSTHPLSVFTQHITVQRSYEHVQRTLSNLELTDRYPDGRVETTVLDPADHAAILRELGLDLPEQDLVALRHLLGG
jgi:N-hydroxyarylamine O-acetyltransferase